MRAGELAPPLAGCSTQEHHLTPHLDSTGELALVEEVQLAQGQSVGELVQLLLCL